MRFEKTTLSGVYVIEPELLSDERGFFARSFCQKEFEAAGLEHNFVQSSISFNSKARTLRGMHFQNAPHEEIKLVRCTAGAIYDVVVDLRESSSTYKHWLAVELSASNRKALYIPRGFAHGFETLLDNSEVLYYISDYFIPESAAGIHYADPAVGISWPHPPEVISERDLALGSLKTSN
ncbi:MAG: dTDP-4-dehydrorhamnose 3,5-epimerase [Candidatus Obscuribacterales bacterium]|nr:dTDP-4-dehydrorhamnose 3,5-epimerase [Candidatus Obscuribacterales bacterium]